MKKIRKKIHDLNLIPVFHYTSISATNLILLYGLRMSANSRYSNNRLNSNSNQIIINNHNNNNHSNNSQNSNNNHNDNSNGGGVNVSMKSPLSYGLGQDSYESNLIKDLYGINIKDDPLFTHQSIEGDLDVCIVYGCPSCVLDQIPGAMQHSKMFSKSVFMKFSLGDRDGNYFLRPDRILGAFVVNHAKLPLMNAGSQRLLKNEISYDQFSIEKLNEIDSRTKNNSVRMNKAIIVYNPNTTNEGSMIRNESSLFDAEGHDNEVVKRASVGISTDHVHVANPLKLLSLTRPGGTGGDVQAFPRPESTSGLSNIELVDLHSAPTRGRKTSAGGFSETSLQSDSDHEEEKEERIDSDQGCNDDLEKLYTMALSRQTSANGSTRSNRSHSSHRSHSPHSPASPLYKGISNQSIFATIFRRNHNI